MKLFLISVFVQDIGIISINIINMLNRRRNTVNDKKRQKNVTKDTNTLMILLDI